MRADNHTFGVNHAILLIYKKKYNLPGDGCNERVSDAFQMDEKDELGSCGEDAALPWVEMVKTRFDGRGPKALFSSHPDCCEAYDLSPPKRGSELDRFCR
jgi:hypothetical protein